MKKLSFILLSLWCATLCFGQFQKLSFTTKFYDAIDKWIAYPNDSRYVIGFLYIDRYSGITFYYETDAINTSEGLTRKPGRSATVGPFLRQSIRPNVAILSDETIEHLGLPKEPAWLKDHKRNSKSYYMRIGRLYNSIGASHHAIEPLLKVYEKKPHHSNVELQLAFAYNATGQYDKAVAVLTRAIEHKPNNPLFYRELGFTLMQQGKINEAEAVYLKGMKVQSYWWEPSVHMGFSMLHYFFTVRDKPKFDKWKQLTMTYIYTNAQLYQYVKDYEENWDKQ